jgi:transaldolase
MKIFIDTANLTDIEEALKRGFASGVTTNPSLLAKEPKSSFEGHVGKIIDLIKHYSPGAHLSVEVFSTDPDEILRQAESFVSRFDYPQLSIKVQVGWNELATIKKLASKGISVNCTACMSVSQAIMAAHAGAKYVSLFWGRIRSGGEEEKFNVEREKMFSERVLDNHEFNPPFVMKSVRYMIDRDGLDTEIIAGSIRGIVDIRDAALSGAHIVTIPPKFYPSMMQHFKTDEVINQFMTDFKEWMS